jgi:hypothetical protein
MPLIDLKTNLKSLKYGSDQPGGGWSKQPFIEFPIEDAGTPITILDFYKGNRTNPDFPIRGGGLKFDLGTQTFTISSQIDKSRIKKFFESKPRGTAFLQKQIGLNLSNPKIETGNSFQVVPGSNLIPGLLENTRIYNNGINTLTQVGFQGTGTHLPRQGVFPFDFASKYYKDIVGAQSLLNSTEVIKINRLLILQNLKLSTSATSANLGNINQINKLGISLNRNTLFKYLGGPGSAYGVGTTTIKRVEDTSQAARKFVGQQSMTYDNIMAQKLNTTNNGKRTTYIQDYKTGKKIESREQIYKLTLSGSADSMQSLSSFIFNSNDNPWDYEIYKESTKDIIKFVFEAIENSDTSKSFALFFRAMINGFTDNHQASINSFKYQGRGEDFYTYQGVSRIISFGFKIGIQSESEFKSTYAKLNHLISQVYPDYSATYGVMRAPMIRLTIGDYLYRVAGMLENVNIAIDDNYPWEINKDNLKLLKQLPQVINVQCTFKPIQDFVPRRINIANPNVPYMTNQSETYLDNLIFTRQVETVPNPNEPIPEINEGTQINVIGGNTTNSFITSFN